MHAFIIRFVACAINFKASTIHTHSSTIHSGLKFRLHIQHFRPCMYNSHIDTKKTFKNWVAGILSGRIPECGGVLEIFHPSEAVKHAWASKCDEVWRSVTHGKCCASTNNNVLSRHRLEFLVLLWFFQKFPAKLKLKV